ncbi:hypothetical protein WP1_076 [Pseudomonas phage WP1]
MRTEQPAYRRQCPGPAGRRPGRFQGWLHGERLVQAPSAYRQCHQPACPVGRESGSWRYHRPADGVRRRH